MNTPVMRTCLLLASLLILDFLLSACNGTTSPSNEMVLSDIYTSVAITLAARSTPVKPTATPIDISTSIPTSTQILGYPTIPTSTTYSSSSLVSNANGCDNSAFVSDVTVSDGTELAPGEAFTKTWKFKNIGSCTWSDSYSITFISGNDMDGSDTDIGSSVGVGDTAEISVSLITPSTVGTYTGYWRLANESGSVFGEKVYVQIVASDDVATITVTPTATSTSETDTSTTTSTPTSAKATSTSVATSTKVVSTSTPTSIPATATSLPTNTAIPTTAPTSTPAVSPTVTPAS